MLHFCTAVPSRTGHSVFWRTAPLNYPNFSAGAQQVIFTRVWLLPDHFDFTLQFLAAVIVLAPLHLVEQLKSMRPAPASLGEHFDVPVHVAQMVPDHRVVAIGQ